MSVKRITAVVSITRLVITANRSFSERSDGRITLISIVLDVMAPLWLWEGAFVRAWVSVRSPASGTCACVSERPKPKERLFCHPYACCRRPKTAARSVIKHLLLERLTATWMLPVFTEGTTRFRTREGGLGAV